MRDTVEAHSDSVQSDDTETEVTVADTQAEASPAAENGFASLGLRPELLKALDELGYEEPTPIQRETIPYLMAGKDLLGQAATGTGKTAAFALPALQLIDGRAANKAVALVLVPTRELAMQVSEAFFRYGKDLGAKCVPVYGGQPIFRQLQALDRGVHIVVGTPGRIIDHIGRGSLPLDAINAAMLDESHVVRVAAAKALLRLGQKDRAIAEWVALLKSPQEWVAYYAMLELDELGVESRPVASAPPPIARLRRCGR